MNDNDGLPRLPPDDAATVRDQAAPPEDLTSDPRSFWKAAGPLEDPTGSLDDVTPVLEQLGPPPFPRGGFPLIGFLATVYEHVARSAQEVGGIAPADPNRRG